LSTPKLYVGDLFVDDRGDIGFANSFTFAGVKRSYWVTNHKAGYVRAWHAHHREEKYFLAVKGASLIGAVEIDNWEKPSKDAKIWRYTLSEHKPSILYVPAGYANGFMSLTDDARIIIFSTLTLEESEKDDIRYPARYWDTWNVSER
jgi:dTDP-4-dehydrorhamnose 3,5-epimerase-like enzyme